MDPRKMALFACIDTRAVALGATQGAAWAFLLVAAVHTVLAPGYGIPGLLEAMVYGAGGLILLLSRSRAVAVVLLVLAVLGAGVTIASRLAGGEGGTSPFLALATVAIAARAVEATFRLRDLLGREPSAVDTVSAFVDATKG